jgi:cytochrome c556
MNWKSRLILSGISAVIVSLASFGVQKNDQTSKTNPLIQEMNALDRVFRDVVSGVALSDGHRVHAAIEKMHGTMEKTHEGVRLGTVKLGKNAERLNEFVEQDKRFHAMLEDLAGAARKNDSAAMVSLTQKLLSGCVQCHQEFRKS